MKRNGGSGTNQILIPTPLTAGKQTLALDYSQLLERKAGFVKTGGSRGKGGITETIWLFFSLNKQHGRNLSGLSGQASLELSVGRPRKQLRLLEGSEVPVSFCSKHAALLPVGSCAVRCAAL